MSSLLLTWLYRLVIINDVCPNTFLNHPIGHVLFEHDARGPSDAVHAMRGAANLVVPTLFVIGGTQRLSRKWLVGSAGFEPAPRDYENADEVSTYICDAEPLSL